MKTKLTRKIKGLLSIVAILALTLSCTIVGNVNAADQYSFSVSPMKEKILLNPGDHYTSSVSVYTSTDYNTDVKYKVEVADFFVDENYENIFSDCQENYCEMKNWITIDSPTEGRLAPGEKAIINYTINVPEDAPGGGQYASIIFQGDLWTDETSDGDGAEEEGDVASKVKEERKIAHLIYAEVAGDINRQGEIVDVNVPSFLLSGDIKGTAAIKNTGNVHGDATYKLQVFPLFSDEEVYTNVEKPATATILPDRTRYEEIAWDQTPNIGIFNVVYTVEFEGVTAQVSKLVIKCPVWLLFIILFVIIALIMWIIMRVRANKKIKAKEQN